MVSACTLLHLSTISLFNMKDYRSFSPDDFLNDPLFRAWILDRDEKTKNFWEKWLAENQDKTESFNQAAAILYTIAENENIISDAEVEDRIGLALLTIRNETSEKTNYNGKINWFRIAGSIAAILVIIVGVRWLLHQNNIGADTTSLQGEIYKADESDIIKKNDSGIPDTIRLEENSFVVLKTSGELRYPAHFSKTNRTVHLKGEAFFQVSKESDRPFIVFANDVITKVLGTSFTVRAYEKDNKTLVSVLTGRVSVFLSKDHGAAKQLHSKEIAGVVLTPNQEVVYQKQDTRLLKRIVEEPRIIAAVPGLDFEEKPVKDIFTVLQAAYGIEMVYDEKALSACMLTANLTEVTLYQGLDLICKILPETSYEIIDGKVVIYSKGCKNFQ